MTLKHPGFRFLVLCLFTLFLSGCGTYYQVSIDSLADTDSPRDVKGTYIILPDNERVSADDLMFKEIARRVEPVLRSRGYMLVSEIAEADHAVFMAYWEGEPRVSLETRIERRSVPVRTRRGHIDYVWVEEPTVSTTTTYFAHMLLKGCVLTPDKRAGKQLWRTSVQCGSGEGDFRKMINSMMGPLERTLGTQTFGVKRFEVFVDNDGNVSVEEKSSSDWW